MNAAELWLLQAKLYLLDMMSNDLRRRLNNKKLKKEDVVY